MSAADVDKMALRCAKLVVPDCLALVFLDGEEPAEGRALEAEQAQERLFDLLFCLLLFLDGVDREIVALDDSFELLHHVSGMRRRVPPIVMPVVHIIAVARTVHLERL